MMTDLDARKPDQTDAERLRALGPPFGACYRASVRLMYLNAGMYGEPTAEVRAQYEARLTGLLQELAALQAKVGGKVIDAIPLDRKPLGDGDG